MKAKIYIFYLFLFLNYGCVRTIVKNDLLTADLHHRVKSVRMLNTTYNGGNIVKNEGPWDTYVLYNGAGNELERTGWRMNGRLSFRQQLEYDANAHLVSKMVYQGNGKLREKYSYRFDEFGNQVEKRVHNTSGKIVRRLIMLYDERGNKTETQCHQFGKISYRHVHEFTADNKIKTFTIYEGNTTIEKQSIYTYNENEIEIRVVDGLGKELSREIRKMDENGNVLAKHNYHEGDSLAYKSKMYQYDKWGNEIDYRSYVLGRMVSQKTAKYDRKGRIAEQVKYKSKKKFVSKFTYQYDSKGNRIAQLDYNKEGTIKSSKTWKYQYDKHKNWIEKQEYQEGAIKVLSLREVVYY